MDLNIPISTFNLSQRAYNIAIREGILSLKDLLIKRKDFDHMKGVGSITLMEFNKIIYDFIKANFNELTGSDLNTLIKEAIDVSSLSRKGKNLIMDKQYVTVDDLINNENLLTPIEHYEFDMIISKHYKKIIDYFISNYVENIIDINPNIGVVSNDYSNSFYYIPISRKKTMNKKLELNKRQDWKRPLNDYLYEIYLNRNSESFFDLSVFLKILNQTFSDVEQVILKNVLGFIGSYEQKRYSEIANDFGITGERVRQLEKNVLNRIKEVILSLKDTKVGKDLINSNRLIKEDCDYDVLNFKCEEFADINGKYLSLVYSVLLSDVYGSVYISQSRDPSEILFVYKKDVLDKNVIDMMLDNVDKLYDEKRPEEVSYSKDLLLSKVSTHKMLGIIFGNKGYEKLLCEYLSFVYYIFDFNNSFIFPGNKKDLKYLVAKELELFNEPIHYSKMYNIVVQKYPEYIRNISKVHTILGQVGKNVGDGLFVKKSSEMIGGTIVSLAEMFLEKTGKPEKYEDIEKFILDNKIVKSGSLLNMIFGDSQKRFVKISDGKIGLKKWNLDNEVVNRKDNYTLDNDVFNYMKKDPSKEYTVKEIIEYLGDVKYQNVFYAMKLLINDGKINYFTRGKTNYYYIV